MRQKAQPFTQAFTPWEATHVTAIVAEQTRGPLVETIFRGDIAVVDAAGRLLFQAGSAHKVTFWRSSAKPIQAMPVVLTGAADAFAFRPEHLAIFSASHNGEPVHVDWVLDAQKRAGLSPDLLQCGVHRPFDREAAEALEQAGREPKPVHNNCSGKHTAMLAIAKYRGLPLESYLDPASELQQLILRCVADVVGMAPEAIALGVDGCGVPVFGMPLANMARAFARLAEPERMPAGMEQAGRRFREAMLKYSYLVAGRRRICTDLMALPGRRFVAKSGAEGVYCVGVLPEAVAASPVLRELGVTGGVGIAVKAEDGNNHARHLMVVESLRQLGLLNAADLKALERYGPQPVKNHAGRVVGELRPAFTLERVAG